ncbi:MAG: hypothetical protein Tsb005_19240 [Gammaproteobacteria bacterium]
MNICTDVANIDELKIALKNDILNENVYFRGQAKNWPLLPSVWRESEKITMIQRYLQKIEIQTETLIQDKINTVLNQYRQYPNTITDNQCVENSIRLLEAKRDFIKKWVLKINLENQLLVDFYTRANASGLNVEQNILNVFNEQYPSYFATLRREAINYFWLSFSRPEFPSGLFLDKDKVNLGLQMLLENSFFVIDDLGGEGLIAFDKTLPQHYDLPTRVLDWTNNINKAICHAIYSWLSWLELKQEGKEKNIYIYALNVKKHVNTLDDRGRCLHSPIKLYKYLPRDKNAFLHQQDGILTEINWFGDFYFMMHGKWPSYETMQTVLGEIAQEYFELKSFALPINLKLAEEYLNYLSRYSVTYSSMMPAYSSIARELALESQFLMQEPH